jgi:hypothetical protein
VTNGKAKGQVIGKTKEAVAKVTGDRKLAEEGKEQVKKSESEPLIKPLGNLCNRAVAGFVAHRNVGSSDQAALL